jgi:hypothetical protein
VSNYLPSNPAAKLERRNLVKGETVISRQNRLSFFAFFCGIRPDWRAHPPGLVEPLLGRPDCDLADSDHKDQAQTLIDLGANACAWLEA